MKHDEEDTLPPAFVKSYSERQGWQIPLSPSDLFLLLWFSFLALFKTTYIHLGKYRNDKEGNKNLSDDT